MDADKTFGGLMNDKRLQALKDAVGHPSECSIVLGDRRYSPNDLDRTNQAVPAPRPAAGFDMPTARQGGWMGGVTSAGISTVDAPRTARSRARKP